MRRSTFIRGLTSALIASGLAACASAPQPDSNATSTVSAQASIPKTSVSDESNEQLLRLAKEQGESYQKALDYMVHQQAQDGQETRAGDYIVGYAIEAAEGYYEPHDHSLEYKTSDRSTENNTHVEVVVRDGADGRFVPNLTIHGTLIGSDGKEFGTKEIPFMWHPWLYHYGENWRVPSSGTYKLRVVIDPPKYRRHDQMNGARYTQPVVVTFPNVKIKTGTK